MSRAVSLVPELSVPLALYDFLPVALTAAALWALSRAARHGAPDCHGMVVAGGILVVAGGLSKALWKLIAAVTGQDVAWLAASLFPLMAPGFILLGVGTTGVARALQGRAGWHAWPIALVAIATIFAWVLLRQWLLGIPRGWFLPLLTGASLGNLWMSLQLIRAALWLRRRAAAALVLGSLAMVLVLPVIAMAGAQSVAMHWIEQSLTVVGAACLLAAVLILWRSVAQSGESTEMVAGRD